MRLSSSLIAIAAALAPAPGEALEPGAVSAVEQARTHLVETLHARYPDVQRFEVAPLVTARVLDRARNAVSVDVVVAPSVTLARRVHTRLHIDGGNGAAVSLGLWWSVRAYRDVAVVLRSLRPGDVVHDDTVGTELREIAGVPDVLTDRDMAQQATPVRAKRFLAAGTMLRTTDLEPLPDVLRERPVRVRVIAGAVRIETRAVAQRDGWRGERIAVTNPVSGERYMAEVSGSGEVQVWRNP